MTDRDPEADPADRAKSVLIRFVIADIDRPSASKWRLLKDPAHGAALIPVYRRPDFPDGFSSGDPDPAPALERSHSPGKEPGRLPPDRSTSQTIMHAQCASFVLEKNAGQAAQIFSQLFRRGL